MMNQGLNNAYRGSQKKDFLKGLLQETRLNVIVTVTRSCVLRCRYCYATDPGCEGRGIISDHLLEKIIRDANETRHDSIVFEWTGGEVLLAGRMFFERVLELQRRYMTKPHENSVQTSGALYDEELYRFLIGNGFSVSVTLDGPRALHDAQRPYADGRGSFETVMQSVHLLKQLQGECGVLCTVTRASLPYLRALTQFYRQEGMRKWHANPYIFDANKPVGEEQLGLTASEYAETMETFFEDWIACDDECLCQRNVTQAIEALMAFDHTSVCTNSGRCLTNFVNISPSGRAYPCPKFLGDERFQLGQVDRDHLAQITSPDNPVMDQLIDDRMRAINRCIDRGCPFLGACNGGCPYASLLSGNDGRTDHVDATCEGRQQFLSQVDASIRSHGGWTTVQGNVDHEELA